MRRIYESQALYRDDDEAFAPSTAGSERPRSFRSLPGAALSRRLLPERLARRAISVELETPRREYSAGEPIQFRVTMENAMPFPVSIRTDSPVLWTWHVDGERSASRVRLRDPPDERRRFTFDRGERKQFTRRWRQLFRVSDSEWVPASPGEHTIGAGVNVEAPAEKGLYDETTIRIVTD